MRLDVYIYLMASHSNLQKHIRKETMPSMLQYPTNINLMIKPPYVSVLFHRRSLTTMSTNPMFFRYCIIYYIWNGWLRSPTRSWGNSGKIIRLGCFCFFFNRNKSTLYFLKMCEQKYTQDLFIPVSICAIMHVKHDITIYLLIP